MASQPKVSVIVPFFNASGILWRTLRSIATQDYSNVQLILIDDGSTDSSYKEAEDFAQNNPQLELILKRFDNRGAYAARESGILLAEGSYIAFCDAGDEFKPSFLRSMVDMIEKNNAEMAVCAFLRTGPKRNSLEMAGFGSCCLEVDAESGWLTAVNTALWNKLFKRELFKERYELEKVPRIGEDALLLYSLYPHVKRMVFVNKPLYTYHVSSESAMSNMAIQELEKMAECWKLLRINVLSAQPGFVQIIDLAAMVHIGVSAPLLLARTRSEKVRKGCQFSKKELDNNFPTYRHSPFLSADYLRKFPQMNMISRMYLFVSHNLMTLGAYAYRLASSLGLQLGW